MEVVSFKECPHLRANLFLYTEESVLHTGGTPNVSSHGTGRDEKGEGTSQ